MKKQNIFKFYVIIILLNIIINDIDGKLIQLDTRIYIYMEGRFKNIYSLFN